MEKSELFLIKAIWKIFSVVISHNRHSSILHFQIPFFHSSLRSFKFISEKPFDNMVCCCYLELIISSKYNLLFCITIEIEM